MDLFGPTRTLSLGGKKYGFIRVDDYSRYTWVYFLAHKHESFKVFEYFVKAVNTTCYVQNRIFIRPLIKKTPYELSRGRRPNISYFHPF